MPTNADYGARLCTMCRTAYVLHHKFNGGNPVDVWLPECDCIADLVTQRFFARLGRRTSPNDGSET